MMLASLNGKSVVLPMVLVLLLPWLFEFVCGEQQTIAATNELSKVVKHDFPKKHWKRLKKQDGAIRLVGGRNEHEGNIEILHNRKWGNICDDEWDTNEAEVVCRQLGYSGYHKVTHSSLFGAAKRRFWMDNLMCDGNEKDLSDCRFEGWGKNDCDATEAAGVVCQSESNEFDRPKTHRKKSKHRFGKHFKMEVRLTGGRNRNEGQVEIRFNKVLKKGHWGSVCGDGWSLLEANVVCKSLGLGYATAALQTDYFSDPLNGQTLPRLLISGSECFGNETDLHECQHHELGDISCAGKGEQVAGVICTHEMADLVFDHVELERSAHLEDRPLFMLQCAMEENCLATQAYAIQREHSGWQMETRRLLKFTATVLNAGNADFRPAIPKHLWEWHMCHMHYHSMEVFATFNIYNATGHKVAEGHKASFCLEDNQCLPGVQPKYACANFGDQGITVNCSDIYRYNIDCQWVDITEMDTGLYTIKISVNPEFKVAEMAYDNNAAKCMLLYTETYARVYDCKLERP